MRGQPTTVVLSAQTHFTLTYGPEMRRSGLLSTFGSVRWKLFYPFIYLYGYVQTAFVRLDRLDEDTLH
jgi:hypothetical protein